MPKGKGCSTKGGNKMDKKQISKPTKVKVAIVKKKGNY